MSKVVITNLTGEEIALDTDAELIVGDGHFVIIDKVGRIFVPFTSVTSIWVDRPGWYPA